MVKKYSEFINFPIYLWASKEVDVEVPSDDESSEEDESCMPCNRIFSFQLLLLISHHYLHVCFSYFHSSLVFVNLLLDIAETTTIEDEETRKVFADRKPLRMPEKETIYEWEVLNDVKAIWLRNPKEVTDEEYASFYRSITKVDCEYPLSN